MKMPLWISGVALAAVTVTPAVASDRYESAIGAAIGDDDSNTLVELLHGRLRVHDLEEAAATPDEDWSFVQETLRHSYEVTVMNTPLRWSSLPAAGYVTMNRVDASTNILTPGEPLNLYTGAFAVRWIATPMARAYSFIRVVGLPGLGTDAVYEIQLRDTTYMIPRWNNSGSQVTVFVIQNTTDKALTGNLYFYSPNGTLLFTDGFPLAPYGLYVVSTASIGGPLAGQSGSAAIAHTGSYGALSGKAVALEPATGFTFDTLLTPIPH